MTEETKKIFVAPWKRAQNLSRNGSGATRGLSPSRIVDSDNKSVAYAYPTLPRDKQKTTANRLVRLPELYDALREAAGGKCWSCAGVNVDTVLDNGCPKGNDETCYVAKWIEILRKVRDGE